MEKESKISRLYTREHGTVDYDPHVPCIIVTHVGFATDDEFMNILNYGLTFAIEKKKECGQIGWLADVSQMEGNTMADWVACDWNPRVVAVGIYYLAFVHPKNVFGQLQIRDYVQQNNQNANEAKMITSSFDDIARAKQWLHEKVDIDHKH